MLGGPALTHLVLWLWGVSAPCPAVLVAGLHTLQRTFLHLPRRLSIRYTDERVCAFFRGQTLHRRQASSRRGGQCSPSRQVRGLPSKEPAHGTDFMALRSLTDRPA